MDMNTALDALLDDIRADYVAWTNACAKGELSDINRDMIADFSENLTIEEGRKYIKIVKGDGGQRCVWGFVVATDTDKKFRKGDILKAAGWATPARNHARGNILEGGYSIQWTGPHYM